MSQQIDPLEFRYLLSSSAIAQWPVAMPTYESVQTGTNAQPATTSGPTGFTPQQIRQAYGFDQFRFSNGTNGDGSGTTIAIVDAYDDPNIAYDLHQFDSTFGLPDPILTKVNQRGGATLPAANSNWITEIALDVEWSQAVAPKANILLVEADSNSLADLTTAVNLARGASGVVAVSMSWGANEFNTETSFDSFFTTPSGHPGVTFVVSSGDRGSPVSYPSASPKVLSVGGTSLYTQGGAYSGESGWGGSGGGISAFESKPGYQNGIVTQSTNQRTNPDVAYDADPYTGVPVYDSYNNGTTRPWGQWGGTSAGAPQWAALVAIADQGRAIEGLGSLDGNTQLLPTLYHLPSSDFHDITTGTSNGFPVYTASPGYDLVTGRGTPIANTLISDLVTPPNSNSPTRFIVLAPANIVTGVPFSVTVSAVDSANAITTNYLGSIQFSSTDATTGVNLPSRYTFTAADHGSHTFSGIKLITPGIQSINVKDSTTNSINGTASLTVLIHNSPPVLSGSNSFTYVKTQAATVISPGISINAAGSATLSSATVKVVNFVTTDDVLSFANNDPSRFGNIARSYDTTTGILTLTSADSSATVDQYQAALRAVTYFDQRGQNAVPGTRSVAYQVSNGSDVSNSVTSLITISNPSTTSTLSASATSLVFGQPVTLVSAIRVLAPGTGVPTAGLGYANVTFMDGANVLTGTVKYNVVDQSLTASLTTTSLSIGSHSITAIYSGDANYSGSSSAPVRLTVAHTSTTTSVTSSMPWAVYGMPLTLSATVSSVGAGAGSPGAGSGTANVAFMEGANILPGTVNYTVINGNLVASLTIFGPSTGIHVYQAIYSGDTNYSGSVSAAFKQVSFHAGTNTKISSSAASAVVGKPVTLTATVSAFSGVNAIPTGGVGNANVTFMDGTNVLNGMVVYSVVNGALIASLTTSSLTAGSHLITAGYSGDGNFSSSTSSPLNQRVGPFGTTSGLSVSVTALSYSQSLTLVSTIRVVAPGTGIPTAGTGNASVTFKDGANTLTGTVTYSVVNGYLTATMTTTNLPVGLHTISAVYSGDANYSGSTSTPQSVKVSPVGTTCVISSSMTWGVYGVPITYTATVSLVGPGAGSIASIGKSSVVFFEGTNVLLGQIDYKVINGNLVASLTLPSVTTGVHLIRAVYSGEADYAGSFSQIFKQVVFHAGTITKVASSAVNSTFGQSITLTATVSALSGVNGTPTAGSVTFMDGTNLLNGTVVYSVVNGKLIASLTTSSLIAGEHAISASYSGDANFSSSTAAVMNQRVGSPGNTIFAFARICDSIDEYMKSRAFLHDLAVSSDNNID